MTSPRKFPDATYRFSGETVQVIRWTPNNFGAKKAWRVTTETEANDQPLLNIMVFGEHLRFLKAHGYDVDSMPEVLITFDDNHEGYRIAGVVKNGKIVKYEESATANPAKVVPASTPKTTTSRWDKKLPLFSDSPRLEAAPEPIALPSNDTPEPAPVVAATIAPVEPKSTSVLSDMMLLYVRDYLRIKI